jgi:glycosyltransferase involved in cell wall biosynthesis
MNSSEPLVSILIPAYNAERYLAYSIKSALEQTWRNTEIIVVDDGSSDDTLCIARSFESKKVRVLTQKNVGAAATRNRAYSCCQGEYIQWLDADDLLHPEKIACQIQAAKRSPEKRTLLSSAWGYFYYRYQKARFEPTALWCDLNPAEWMMRQMEQNLHMQTATWLVSRELSEVAGPWDSRMLSDDDGEYFCRVMLGSNHILFAPEAKTYYRRTGPGSLSYIGKSERKLDAQFLAMKLRLGYMRSLEDSKRSRAACIRYLQNWITHFYPDRPDIIEQFMGMASDLGGELHLPQFPLKYRWIEVVFGTARAGRAQMLLPRYKENLIRMLDSILHRMSPRFVWEEYKRNSVSFSTQSIQSKVDA